MRCNALALGFTMPYQLTNYVPDLCAGMVSNLFWDPYPRPWCPIKNGCQLEHTRRRPCENPCSSRTRRCHFSPIDGWKGQKHAGHQTEVPLFWHNCLTWRTSLRKNFTRNCLLVEAPGCTVKIVKTTPPKTRSRSVNNYKEFTYRWKVNTWEHWWQLN